MTARALEVTLARYERAVSSYLDVTDAQPSSLAADRAASQIRTQQLLAAVNLARSLGGEWMPDAALAQGMTLHVGIEREHVKND